MATEHRIDGRKPKRRSRTAGALPDKDRPVSNSVDHEADSPVREAPAVSSSNEDSSSAIRLDESQDDPQSAFDSLYLQQMTKEIATDLDKLRTANDFRPTSLPLLIEALKQGTACFSDSERLRVASGLRKE